MKKINTNLVLSFISKRYICPIPLSMKMKNHYYTLIALSALSLASCGILGKKDRGGALPNDGQVHGIAPGTRYTLPKPPGMVYIPQGTFHMGPSDEDPAYAFSARNRAISISGFWMDATEITNNEYRQFVHWVRDSVAAKKLGFVKTGADGNEYVDQQKMKTLNWGDPKVIEQLSGTDLILSPEERIFGKKEIDASKLIYHSETFDLKEAAKRENAGKPRSQFIVKKDVRIYPDTLAWIRDFSYSYNEPMTKRYFSHPAFGNYPVVGVTWQQAHDFCLWRSDRVNEGLLMDKGLVSPQNIKSQNGAGQDNFTTKSYLLGLYTPQPGRGVNSKKNPLRDADDRPRAQATFHCLPMSMGLGHSGRQARLATPQDAAVLRRTCRKCSQTMNPTDSWNADYRFDSWQGLP